MSNLLELESLQRVLDRHSSVLRTRVLTQIAHDKVTLPMVAVEIGSTSKTAPTFGLFGGVHGIEKIGSHLAIHFLEWMGSNLKWDENLQELMSKCRIVSIPIINPVGMWLNRRSNGSGVDIMRNAPTEAEEGALPLVSGHRWGSRLPWYRGAEGVMESETKTWADYVKEEMFQAPLGLALDLHSGFGMVDRLWHPYSRTHKPFPNTDQVQMFSRLMNDSLPNHLYKIESQSTSYLIHGDIWDYLFDAHHSDPANKNKLFIPWTLEMGSWMWVRKNPRQLFSLHGLFNPILPHRYHRIMRRHRPLLNFYLRAAAHYKNWNGPL